MDENNKRISDSREKIEKQSNPKVMNENQKLKRFGFSKSS